MMKIKTPFNFTAIAFLSTLSFHSGLKAESNVKHYQVDLLIFEQTTSAATEQEHFPLLVPGPSYNNAQRLMESSELDITISSWQKLSTHKSSLSGSADALRRHHNYHVLSHQSWIQPMNQSNSKPLYIEGGINYPTHQTEMNEHESFDNEFESTASGLRELDGQIQIHLNRYFDVKMDLTFRKPTTLLLPLPDAPWEPQYQAIQIKHQERIRGHQIYYFDHPEVGVLIHIKEIGGDADSE